MCGIAGILKFNSAFVGQQMRNCIVSKKYTNVIS